MIFPHISTILSGFVRANRFGILTSSVTCNTATVDIQTAWDCVLLAIKGTVHAVLVNTFLLLVCRVAVKVF